MWRNIYLTLGCSMLVVSFASASTYIPGGDVSGIWDAIGSTYYIEGDITVQEGDSLIIEPGVEVNFRGHYSFTIHGFLKAEGTEGDSILIAMDQEISSEGWGGIRFDYAADSCSLSYCIVKWAKPVGSGGGIKCSHSNIFIRHSSIRSNEAHSEMGEYGNGGGIGIFGTSDVMIEYCNITDNCANGDFGGGGICIGWADLMISHCNVSGNTVLNSWSYGGGIAASFDSNVEIDNCTLESNSVQSAGTGGGISVMIMSSMYLTSSNIINNHADYNGGGIHIQESDASIDHCTIEGNSTPMGYLGCLGGGLYCTSVSQLVISHCAILSNSSRIGSGIEINAVDFNIDHCSFVGNSASLNGAALRSNCSNPTIINSIFEGNTGGVIELHNSANDIPIAFCDFYNNEGSNFFGSSLPPGIGQLVTTNVNNDSCDVFSNIFENPLFVDPGFGDFNLQRLSPCIDAGDPSSPPDPDSTRADMGALYFHQEMPVKLTLAPTDPPVVIPETGGEFDFNIEVTNRTEEEQSFDFWSEIELPGWGSFETMSVTGLSIAVGDTVDRNRTQTVPDFAPPGTYTYLAYVGTYPWTVDDYYYFTFEKEGSGDEGSLGTASDWLTFGDAFDDKVNPIKSERPHEFALFKAYPNPFNPSTTISFQLPKDCHINLTVCDVAGRKVVQLIDGWRNAGIHELTFDAAGLASGLYLCHLETAESTTTQKLILMK